MTDEPITREEREIANRRHAFDSIALIGVDATIKSMAAMMSVLEAREAEKDARIRELEEALRPFVNLVAKNEEGEIDDQLQGLPDGHAFDVCWRFDGEGDKSPWVSAGQFRRACAALSQAKQK